MDVEAAPLGKRVVEVRAAPEYQLPSVGLADVHVNAGRHQADIVYRPHRFCHHRLQRDASNRQAQSRHRRQLTAVSGHAQRETVRGNGAPIGLNGGDSAVVGEHAGDFASLDQIHSRVRGLAGITPGDRVVPRNAAAVLDEAPVDWEAAIQVDVGDAPANRFRTQNFGIDSVHRDGICPAPVDFQFMWAVADGENAPRAEHHIEVDFLAEVFEQPKRMFVECTAFGIEVIRPAHHGVTAGVPAAQVPLFEHGDAADALMPGEVIGRRQAMPSRADDQHIIVFSGLAVRPGARPLPVAGQCIPQDLQSRIVHALPSCILHILYLPAVRVTPFAAARQEVDKNRIDPLKFDSLRKFMQLRYFSNCVH